MERRMPRKLFRAAWPERLIKVQDDQTNPALFDLHVHT